MTPVLVNGSTWEAPPGATVATLVGAFCESAAGVAVARNGEVVPRSAWDATPLVGGDEVEIVAAAAGG